MRVRWHRETAAGAGPSRGLKRRRSLLLGIGSLSALCGLALLGACTTVPRPPAATPQARWQGRLSLKVYSKPVQALSANFDLQGRPEQGTLALSTPMGTTLAQLQWGPGLATLQSQGQTQQFGSLQELARKATGTDLPVASLFAWLQGRDEPAPGWKTDLSEIPQGRLQARHVEAVEADLKIILEP